MRHLKKYEAFLYNKKSDNLNEEVMDMSFAPTDVLKTYGEKVVNFVSNLEEDILTKVKDYIKKNILNKFELNSDIIESLRQIVIRYVGTDKIELSIETIRKFVTNMIKDEQLSFMSTNESSVPLHLEKTRKIDLFFEKLCGGKFGMLKASGFLSAVTLTISFVMKLLVVVASWEIIVAVAIVVVTLFIIFSVIPTDQLKSKYGHGTTHDDSRYYEDKFEDQLSKMENRMDENFFSNIKKFIREEILYKRNLDGSDLDWIKSMLKDFGLDLRRELLGEKGSTFDDVRDIAKQLNLGIKKSPKVREQSSFINFLKSFSNQENSFSRKDLSVFYYKKLNNEEGDVDPNWTIDNETLQKFKKLVLVIIVEPRPTMAIHDVIIYGRRFLRGLPVGSYVQGLALIAVGILCICDELQNFAKTKVRIGGLYDYTNKEGKTKKARVVSTKFNMKIGRDNEWFTQDDEKAKPLTDPNLVSIILPDQKGRYSRSSPQFGVDPSKLKTTQ